MPREPIHPGEHLAEELQEIGISARELARDLRVPVTRVTEILRGRRGISGDTALRLARYLQVNADFWMNLQKLYELDLARREIDAELAAIVPRPRGGMTRRCGIAGPPLRPSHSGMALEKTLTMITPTTIKASPMMAARSSDCWNTT